MTPLLQRRYTERFKGVNDLCFASNGDYFTDQVVLGSRTPLAWSTAFPFRASCNACCRLPSTPTASCLTPRKGCCSSR